MKIFTGKLPTISPEFGCVNGETFDDHIYLDTPQGFQQIVSAGLPVHPDYAKAIRAELKTLDPRKTKGAKETKSGRAGAVHLGAGSHELENWFGGGQYFVALAGLARDWLSARLVRFAARRKLGYTGAHHAVGNLH